MPGEQLGRAIALIKAGQRESAREVLIQLVRADPRDTTAWLWLAETMPDDNQRIAVLGTCLKLNPQSQMVKHGLSRLRERQDLQAKTTGEITQNTPVQATPSTVDTQVDQPQARQSTQVEESIQQPYLTVDEPSPALSNQLPNKPTVAQRSTPRQRFFRFSRILLLVLLGVFTVGVVLLTAFILQDELRSILGLPGTKITPTADTSLQLTQTAYARLNTSPTPYGFSPSPTPTRTPIPTPTTTVVFTFQYSLIVPENSAQVVQIGELSAIPAQSVAISADNHLLAAGLDDSTIMVWNISSGDIIYILKGHDKPVNGVVFTPDSRLLVSGSGDGTVRIWDLSTGNEVDKKGGNGDAVKSLAFSPDGRTYVSGTAGGFINIWRLGVDSAIYTQQVGGSVNSLDISPDGRLLAAGLQTGAIQFWDVYSGTLIKNIQGYSTAVNCVVFAPNGHRLAVGSEDKTVKLWDVDTGKVLYTIGTHTEAVLSLSFTPDGRILASASLGQTIKLWNVAERREIAVLRHARNMPSITFSPDGRVLATALLPINPLSREGGVALWGIMYSPEVASAHELVTMATLQASMWTKGTGMATFHVAHKAVPVSGGRLLIIGGGVEEDPSSFTSKVELYNPENNSTELTEPMSESRGSFTATSLVDGRVLVVGGNNISQRWLASAEIYDPVSGLWTPTEPREPHGIGHTATFLMDGRVLVVGGCIGDGPSGWSNRAELFDPATNSWSEAYMMSNSRCNHAAALLSDGRVLVAGGEDGEGILNSTEIFDPATRLWSKTGNLITARSRAEMVRLSDGRLLVTGGLAKDINGLHALITVEIYDIKSGKWTEAASMGHARYGHTADMLPGGLVIVIGGLEKAEMNPDEFLKIVEVYDPEGNTWTEIASLTVPRAFHTTNLLPDGHILVMGGMSQVGSILASTDILVPAPPVIYTPTTIVENTLELDTTPEVETTTTPTSTGEVIVTSTPVNP